MDSTIRFEIGFIPDDSWTFWQQSGAKREDSKDSLVSHSTNSTDSERLQKKLWAIQRTEK